MHGIVLKAISGFYYVNCSGKLYECKARGSFRKAEVSPVVGDGVQITITDDFYGVIDSIDERKNILKRPVIANIDKLFIVSSYTTPAPDTLMIDRLTAICAYHNIEPVIIFNKCDMGSFEELMNIYKNSGFKAFEVSAKSGKGMEFLKEQLKDCICAFAGNSGVGKSSILNAVFDGLSLQTGEVSVKLGRGRHTTRHTELYAHKYGGYVADTPGFSSFESDISDYDFKLRLAECFGEFKEYTKNCRFTSCTHTCEKGCAVLEAVEDGKIEISRHNSYVALFNELKDLKQWQGAVKK